MNQPGTPKENKPVRLLQTEVQMTIPIPIFEGGNPISHTHCSKAGVGWPRPSVSALTPVSNLSPRSDFGDFAGDLDALTIWSRNVTQ